MSPISPITPAAVPDIAGLSNASQKGQNFQTMLESYVGQVQKSQDVAQSSADSFLSGGSEELHTVALATQRAELKFEECSSRSETKWSRRTRKSSKCRSRMDQLTKLYKSLSAAQRWSILVCRIVDHGRRRMVHAL